MRKLTKKMPLFDRIVSILEQARSNVVRAVDINMVMAYWLIGREIVQEIQGGKERASYGKQLMEGLSTQLTRKYGSGFSLASLKTFRQFYSVYSDRMLKKSYPSGSELIVTAEKSYPTGDEFKEGVSSRISWSHYRALMRVAKPEAREFYEHEAIACGWDKRTLERQIHSYYYERMLKSQHPQKMLQTARKEIIPYAPAIESLKNPYVLEFLGLPDVATLHETHLESAIITHLQAFLLELGKGFAFVARQKRMRFENKDLYVDLIFYNCILKCYLLIDLKMGELSHQDVGQMDGYVRMFDDLFASSDDNPTIGLILCAEKMRSWQNILCLKTANKFSPQNICFTCLPKKNCLMKLNGNGV
jgi:predicted nuclease of restriction endonuclease-like (RecB) superfamily